jgi:hypothetical protein
MQKVSKFDQIREPVRHHRHHSNEVLFHEKERSVLSFQGKFTLDSPLAPQPSRRSAGRLAAQQTSRLGPRPTPSKKRRKGTNRPKLRRASPAHCTGDSAGQPAALPPAAQPAERQWKARKPLPNSILQRALAETLAKR